MIARGKHNVLGVMIDAVDYEAAVDRILRAARASSPLAVSALAVHGVMTSVMDEEHRYRLNHLDVIVPDGQPVRWALNLLHGTRLQDRVYGPTLMLKTCERAARDDVPIFLFGGTQELLDVLSRRLCERFPRLQIAGTQASKFRRLEAAEKQDVVDTIRRSGAQIAFVGLGCPRQEVWAFEFRDALSMPLLAVGAAFNFHAGLLAQAPPRMQRFGLEWLFRLVAEPRRLWKRYLLLNPAYVTLFLLQWMRLRTIDASSGQCPEGELLYG